MNDRHLTPHSPWREWLPEHIAGSLTPERRAAVDRHLESCAECRQVADQWQQIALVVRQEIAISVNRISAVDRAQLIRRVTESESNRKLRMTTRPLSPHTRFVRPLSMMSLAMLALLTIVISTIVYRPPTFGSGGVQPPIALQATVRATSSPNGTSQAQPEVSTTLVSATAAPTLTPNMTGTMYARKLNGLPLPAPGDVATLFSPQTTTLTPNQPVGGELTRPQDAYLYTFTASQDGLLEVDVVSFDFTPLIRFYYLDGSPVTYQDSPVNVSAAKYNNAGIYAHVHTGQRIGLYVTSKDSMPGQFTVYPGMRQSMMLLDNRPLVQTFTAQVGQVSPFGKVYYSFDAKAGDVLDVRVKSFDHNDYALYFQGYTDDYAGAPVFYPPLTPSSRSQQCVDLVQVLQCTDDDSGGDTDPELHNVFVSRDRHFDVIVWAVGVLQQPFDFQITLTRTSPSTLSNGNVVTSLLSVKRPTIAYILNDVQKGETIPLLFRRDYGSKLPIYLTATQNGQLLTGVANNGEPSSAFNLHSYSTDPILIFVQYTGYIDTLDAMTNFTLEWPRQQ